jgi:hypothetical protein
MYVCPRVFKAMRLSMLPFPASVCQIDKFGCLGTHWTWSRQECTGLFPISSCFYFEWNWRHGWANKWVTVVNYKKAPERARKLIKACLTVSARLLRTRGKSDTARFSLLFLCFSSQGPLLSEALLKTFIQLLSPLSWYHSSCYARGT